jgi:signal transduction histidine kinase
VLNIISNALKFTEKDGDILVRVYSENENIHITIEDTGIGISEDKLNVIFERFRQLDNSLRRKNEGSGIGLSIVKYLVEVHEGKISVKSEVGKGTEFIIELPDKTISQYKLAEIELGSDSVHDTVEKINIEFSDIYSIHSEEYDKIG